MKIVLQLPEVERKQAARPSKCRYCQGEIFQCWGMVSKRIKDTKVRTVKVPRYKCTSCQKTFRNYPEGISRAQQSERLKKLSVIMWSLGLSHRSVVLILLVFGVCLSHMSGWRSVQREGKQIRQKLKWKPARVVGVDGAWVAGKGIMVAVDLGEGRLLALAEIDEKEKSAVAAWLKTLKQKHQIGAIVTDDLASYKEIADQLGLGHQVCQFHVRRWVGQALRKLEEELPQEWVPVLSTIQHRPEWVVQISLKHAERLIAEVTSKNYPIAAAWLKRAKQAYTLLGKSDEWKKYLKETKEKYKRRPALQSQLARL